MWTILDRYIFAELLAPFGISLGALCFVLLTRELLRLVELLVTKGIAFLSVLKVFANLLPSFLVLTLPIAGIIASITAFGRLSFDKELVAMRSAGLSLVRLSRAVFLFAALVFGLTLALSQWGQPWTNVNLKKVALNLLRDQLVLALEKGVFNEPVPKMVIFVPEAHTMKGHHGVFVSDERNVDEPRVIAAQDYQVLTDPEGNQVTLRLMNGVIHSRPDEIAQYNQVSFTSYDVRISLNPALYAPEERPPLSAVIDMLDRSHWQDPNALRRLVEYYKDLAFPIAALLFCILGIPVGIVSKRSGRVGGFAVGVLIIVVYYVLNVAGEFLVTTLILPPLAGAWLPNGIFLAVTLVAFYHVNRR
jgi:lipopolysaccharide export system permease protein